MTVDTIIVGAGSAGCVLAARLSEEPSRSVALLEAGPDYPTVAELPADVRRGFNPTPTHDWGYVSEPGLGIPAIAQLRAKLVGGCSATNATFALRGSPADYDDWAAQGNPGWSFPEVLSFGSSRAMPIVTTNGTAETVRCRFDVTHTNPW